MIQQEFDPYEGGLRGSGRTTRLADQAIQDLFSKGEVTVKDHYPQDAATNCLLDTIEKRLSFEHPFAKYTKSNFTLTLLK